MRHKMKGRKLGRNSSHRKAMFRNMAASLIKTVDYQSFSAVETGAPKVPGRIVTTVAKAKELRPFVEKLITLAKKALHHEANAQEFATTAPKNSAEWKTWRASDQWVQWANAKAPAVNYRRRAFAMLRDKDALDILFDQLAERFSDREGGYTRIVRLAAVRLGDAGEQALIEFVGVRDREKVKRTAPVVVPTNDDEADSVADDTTAEETSETSDAPAAEATEEVKQE